MNKHSLREPSHWYCSSLLHSPLLSSLELQWPPCCIPSTLPLDSPAWNHLLPDASMANYFKSIQMSPSQWVSPCQNCNRPPTSLFFFHIISPNMGNIFAYLFIWKVHESSDLNCLLFINLLQVLHDPYKEFTAYLKNYKLKLRILHLYSDSTKRYDNPLKFS